MFAKMTHVELNVLKYIQRRYSWIQSALNGLSVN